MVLVIVAAAAMGALALDPSPWLWFGTILLTLPLPLHVYVEHKIKQSSWDDSKKYRGLLFGAAAGRAEEAVAALRASGHAAAVVGTAAEGTGIIRLRQ